MLNAPVAVVDVVFHDKKTDQALFPDQIYAMLSMHAPHLELQLMLHQAVDVRH